MASSSSSAKTSVPDAIFFELSPNIVLFVRIVNVAVLVLGLITFILCLVRGDQNAAYYLLACNTVISAFVGIVVNYWYKSGDLGSEKFWYVLVVATVLAFQCVTTDIFIYKVAEVPMPITTPFTPITNSTPHSNHTQVFTWASFRPTSFRPNGFGSFNSTTPGPHY